MDENFKQQESEFEQIQAKEETNLKKHLFTVTPLLKYLVATLFVALLFVGLWAGLKFGGESKNTEAVDVAKEELPLNNAEEQQIDNLNKNTGNNLLADTFIKILNDAYAIAGNYVYRYSYDDEDTLLKISNESEFNKLLVDVKASGGFQFFKRVRDADPLTFKVMSEDRLEDYAKDKDSIYYEGMKRDVSIAMLKLIASDKNNLFCNGVLIKEADSEIFTFIDPLFAKDEDTLFYLPFPSCVVYDEYIDKNPSDFIVDLKSFAYVADNYYKDKNDVYFHIIALETDDLIKLGADPETFELLDGGFSRDKNNLFYARNGTWFNKLSVLLKGGDPDTLQSIATSTWSSFWKDKNAVYKISRGRHGGYSLSRVEKGDPATFEVLSLGYTISLSKDKNNVYYNSYIIDGVDPATALVIEGIPDLVIDESFVYVSSPSNGSMPQKVDFIDAKTFKIDDAQYTVSNGFVLEMLASDKNNKYSIAPSDDEYRSTTIEIIEPNDFVM